MGRRGHAAQTKPFIQLAISYLQPSSQDHNNCWNNNQSLWFLLNYLRSRTEEDDDLIIYGICRISIWDDGAMGLLSGCIGLWKHRLATHLDDLLTYISGWFPPKHCCFVSSKTFLQYWHWKQYRNTLRFLVRHFLVATALSLDGKHPKRSKSLTNICKEKGQDLLTDWIFVL